MALAEVHMNGREFSHHPTRQGAHTVALHLWALLRHAGHQTTVVDAWGPEGELLFLNGRSTRAGVGLPGWGFVR